MPTEFEHLSVLPQEVCGALIPAITSDDNPVLWDLTFGGGGHSRLLMEKVPSLKVVGVDRDEQTLERAKNDFSDEITAGRLELFHGEFSEISSETAPTAILADLGVSSFQIDEAERGFSFREDGPLDMRMNQSKGKTLRQFLFDVSVNELEEILRDYGQERFAGRIARVIVEAWRSGDAPNTTKELSNLIVKAIPAGARHGQIHAATRSFQALRIALNDELGELDTLLENVILRLKAGGRASVISFHSLEDRKVKRAFKALEEKGFQIVTKKPIVPGEDEQKKNRRSRSAKLRVIEKAV